MCPYVNARPPDPRRPIFGLGLPNLGADISFFDMIRRVARRPASTARLERVDYATLADLRYHIRRFLRVREVAARAVGVEPQHQLCLLQVKGLEGRQPATVGVLAERLQVRHHTVVALVDRLVDRGLVRRRRNPGNRREVLIELTPVGEKVLKTLVLFSLGELRNEGAALVATLKRLVRNPTAVHRRPARRQKG